MSFKKYNIRIKGAVQGVGFRPFIYNLAKSLNIKGTILNSINGVEIEIYDTDIKFFIEEINKKKPSVSYIKSIEYTVSKVDKIPDKFDIIKSNKKGNPDAYILPDIAVCKECLKEIFNSGNRRYLYPFTNCTNCGPRYTIIEKLPYDRQNTTMKKFKMCKKCKEEYENPEDRRFHAQPNACHECGPTVTLWDKSGKEKKSGKEAIEKATDEITKGKIIAVKGLGGFHLFANALDGSTIKLLRERKGREEKPFALMMKDINMAKEYCSITAEEETSLTSVISPIVLVKKEGRKKLPEIINGMNSLNPHYGIMLPYTPLHHIIMNYVNIPVIATSGNISEEPICIDEYEALKKLSNIADLFLVHNRPIRRYVDDSIVRTIMKEETVIRRSRGFVPLPVTLKEAAYSDMVSTGGNYKNSISIKKEDEIFISQHIGDLENIESIKSFDRTINDLVRIYKLKPNKINCDLHPDYESTKYAEKLSSSMEVFMIQHHISHIFSCMAENRIDIPFLGIAWDGTGYGFDGNIWGSEFFLVSKTGIKRIAHLKYFPMPGGDIASRRNYRIGAGLLYQMGKFELAEKILNPESEDNLKNELKLIKTILDKKINVPLTSSMGRLFDGLSAILGIRKISSYEGQAAIELEYKAYKSNFKNNLGEHYQYYITKENGVYIIDWEPVILQIISEVEKGTEISDISLKFHNTMINIILSVANILKIRKVALSGGCFQNKYLLENTILLLEDKGIKTFWQKKVPTNDGGISFGQTAFSVQCEKDKNYYIK